MIPFGGQLRDADHVVLSRIVGTIAPLNQGILAGASGSFEVRQGDILRCGAILLTDREYRLVLKDGQECPIRLTRVGTTGSAVVARVEFRVASDP